MMSDEAGSSVDLFEREDDKHRVRVELVLVIVPLSYGRLAQDMALSGDTHGLGVSLFVCVLSTVMVCGFLGWLPRRWCAPSPSRSNSNLLVLTYVLTVFHIFYASSLIFGMEPRMHLLLRGTMHFMWTLFIVVPLVTPNSFSVLLNTGLAAGCLSLWALITTMTQHEHDDGISLGIVLHLAVPDGMVFVFCRVRLWVHRRRRLYPPWGAWYPEVIGDASYDSIVPIPEYPGSDAMSQELQFWSDDESLASDREVASIAKSLSAESVASPLPATVPGTVGDAELREPESPSVETLPEDTSILEGVSDYSSARAGTFESMASDLLSSSEGATLSSCARSRSHSPKTTPGSRASSRFGTGAARGSKGSHPLSPVDESIATLLDSERSDGGAAARGMRRTSTGSSSNSSTRSNGGGGRGSSCGGGGGSGGGGSAAAATAATAVGASSCDSPAVAAHSERGSQVQKDGGPPGQQGLPADAAAADSGGCSHGGGGSTNSTMVVHPANAGHD